MGEETESSFYPLIFLVGPTAVGKTQLSLQLANRLPSALLNCDSIQMYQGMNIGSDKPDLTDQKNCFLFNEYKPPFTCTAGVFRKTALSILKNQLSLRAVIAVGGSGFYIQALEKGMFPVKQIPERVKEFVSLVKKKRGMKHLYQLLQELDKKQADQISPQDHYRIFRSICLILSEKKPLSLIQNTFQKNQKLLPYPIIKIGLYLPKEHLLERVQIRTCNMIQKGLIEETQTLLDQGLSDWPLMKSVGYKEATLFLKKQISTIEDLQNRVIRRTMRLAKKQMVWFKRDSRIRWYLSNRENNQKIYNFLQKKIQQIKKG